MPRLISDLKGYLYISFLFIISLLLAVLIYGKKPLHLFVNQFNTPFQDVFFKYYTNFGDGLFAIIILIILLFFINFRDFFIGLATFLISGILSQVLKKIFFSDQLRPSKCFDSNELHYVKGVVLHSFNSFPSGHSTTAFAIFLFLAYVIKNKFVQVVFAIMACLTAYSRVYLSQHFFIDVAAGGVIGIASFFLSFAIFNPIKKECFDKKLKIFTKPL